MRRNDEVYLDALGARRIPDPTTAGDFCRRFAEADVERLMDAFNEARLRVWKQQPADFFDEAIIDADGTLVATDGRCKQGVDIAYNGHLGLPSAGGLAGQHRRAAVPGQPQRQPPLARAGRRLPRQGRSPSAAGPASGKITLRGDTDFTQTKHLDRWDEPATSASSSASTPCPTSRRLAEGLPDRGVQRPGAAGPVHDQDGAPPGPERHKERIVSRAAVRDDPKLIGEEVAEFDYRPVACEKTYRVVVLRKQLVVEKGQMRLFERVPLLLLHHQRPHDPGVGGRVPGQRPVRPGEPDRPAQGRRARRWRCRWTTW